MPLAVACRHLRNQDRPVMAHCPIRTQRGGPPSKSLRWRPSANARCVVPIHWLGHDGSTCALLNPSRSVVFMQTADDSERALRSSDDLRSTSIPIWIPTNPAVRRRRYASRAVPSSRCACSTLRTRSTSRLPNRPGPITVRAPVGVIWLKKEKVAVWDSFKINSLQVFFV